MALNLREGKKVLAISYLPTKYEKIALTYVDQEFDPYSFSHSLSNIFSEISTLSAMSISQPIPDDQLVHAAISDYYQCELDMFSNRKDFPIETRDIDLENLVNSVPDEPDSTCAYVIIYEDGFTCQGEGSITFDLIKIIIYSYFYDYINNIRKGNGPKDMGSVLSIGYTFYRSYFDSLIYNTENVEDVDNADGSDLEVKIPESSKSGGYMYVKKTIELKIKDYRERASEENS